MHDITYCFMIKMAKTFFSSSASKRANESYNYGKVSTKVSTTKNSYGSPELHSPSGLLYAICINKHTHTKFCISYKSI